MRRWGLAVLVALAALVGATGPVGAAPADATSSVSDTTPAPGQAITVSAGGLAPGTEAEVYLLPEGRLAQPTVGEDGGFRASVRIPVDSFDGPKQIVVSAVAADNTYAYLVTDVTVRGADAAAELSDTALTPTEPVRVSGTRFRSGVELQIVVLPEAEVLATPIPREDGSFSVDAQMPKDLLNGEHVIVVAGPSAGGGYAFVELRADVTGGVGFARPITDARGLFDQVFSAPSTVPRVTISFPRPTVTTLDLSVPDVDTDDSSSALIIVILVIVLTSGALVLSWLRSKDGKRWLARRRGGSGPPGS